MPQCAATLRDMSHQYHGYLAVGLCALLAREVSALLAAFVENSRDNLPASSVKDSCVAPLLLSLILLVLTMFQSVMAFDESIWVHTADERPVFTIRVVEWTITVPLLLGLSACCGLRRPVAEAAGPILVTEVYIVASWIALLVPGSFLRWALVVGTFVGYVWASGGMLGWVLDFLREAPPDAPCCRLRISSSIMLILLFAMYGVIYLLAIFNVIQPDLEQSSYAFFGFVSKVLMSMLFSAIRVMEHQHELGGLLGQISGVSTAFMSLLRGNFDFVVPCLADPSGTCQLPSASEGDMEELERCLGRPILGSSFNELLAGPLEKQRFAAYVQNALRQVASQQSWKWTSCQMLPEPPGHNQGSRPPVAQVLHVKLERLPSTLLGDEQGGTESSSSDHVSAVVYLSAVPHSGPKAGLLQQMVVGLRLAPEDSAGVQDQPSPIDYTNHLQVDTQDQLDDLESEDEATGAHAGGLSIAMRWREGKASARQRCQRRSMFKLKSRLGQAGRNRSLPRSEAKEMLVRQVWSKRRNHSAKRLVGHLRKSLGNHGKRVCFPPVDEDSTLEADKDDSRSLRWGGSDADLLTEPFRGAWDACSQSSRLSYVGSVTAACRQLLGPLHDHLPPPQLLSKRVEDHIQCAAEMVRLKASARIKTLHHEQQLQEWERRKDGHITSALLNRSKPPQTGIDEEVWRSHLLPHLQEPTPGRPPEKPNLPDDTELWYQAWMHTYESESESDDVDDGSSDSEGGPVTRGPAQHARLTSRTDPRMRPR